MLDDNVITSDPNILPVNFGQAEPESVIDRYATWQFAWNRYMQTMLYFQPDMFFELFTYQQIISTIARTHRFDAVYAYDREFRLQIAAQKPVPPEQRTAKWTVKSMHLAGQHLQADTLFAPCSI